MKRAVYLFRFIYEGEKKEVFLVSRPEGNARAAVSSFKKAFCTYKGTNVRYFDPKKIESLTMWRRIQHIPGF